MRRFILAALIAASPAAALATTWTDVPIIDHNCSAKYAKDPDAHAKACLEQCAGSGLGILDHGTWLKLDKEGNEKALSALKASPQKDHLRVNVTGERKGNVVHVSSIALAT